MLKLIYKTFLVSILSVSLLVMDFSTKGLSIQSAHAEQVETKVDDSNLMATLMLTAVAIVSIRLAKCKMSLDTGLVMAGGAAFLAGEVISISELKDAMEKITTEIKRDKKGKIDAAQVASLEQLKASYEDAKDAAKTKKTLQQAAAAAFLAAAISAYSSAAEETAALTACETALGAAATACAGSSATGCPTCAAGGAQALAVLKLRVAKFADDNVPKGSSLVAAEAAAVKEGVIKTGEATSTVSCPLNGAAVVGPCAAIAGVDLLTKVVCPISPGLAANDILNLNKSLYANAYTPAIKESGLASLFKQFFLNDARADVFTPLGITLASTIVYVLGSATALGQSMDALLFAPMNRAITYGVFAGLAYAASSATDNVIGDMESNIEKIDNVINPMNAMAQGTTGSQINKQTPGVQTTIKPGVPVENKEEKFEDVDLSKNGSMPCFTGPDPKNCKAFSEVSKSLVSNLDSESQKQIKSIFAVADGVNGKSRISGSTLAAADQLGNSANALRKVMANARKKAEESFKLAKVNHSSAEIEKKVKADLEKGVRDALKKSNSTASEMVASIFNGRGTNGAAVATGNKSAKSTVAAVGAGSFVAPSAPKNLGLSDLETDPNAAANVEEGSEVATATATMDDYVIKNDIAKDTGPSLFDLISNRYQRSGYQRLFEKLKKEPQSPVKN